MTDLVATVTRLTASWSDDPPFKLSPAAKDIKPKM